VLARLERRRKAPPNSGQGAWNALESALYRRQYQERARSRRLLRLLRGYRQAATAMHDGALIVQRTSSRIVWFNKAARRLLGLHYPRSLDTNLLDALDSPHALDWLLAGRADEPLVDVP
jgi:two-component system phosphate regulon sensor histidine kinase PhoR